MPKATLEIVEYDPRLQELAAPECGSRERRSLCALLFADLLNDFRLRYRAATRVLAVAVVLALHGLVLVPLFASGTATVVQPRFGAPTVIEATLIEDRSALTLSPPALSAPKLRPIAVALPDDPDLSKADPSLAALQGRYLGEIHARINRAWVRPRSAIGAGLFRCQVEVEQGRDGTVQTLTLQHCNGTTRWQQSLVRGIDDASPLPAPPSPAVFAHRVVLHFQSVAYAAGQPADDYEPVRPPLSADTAGSTPLTQIRSLRRLTQRSRAPAVIELRINGSHIQVEPQR